MPENDGRKPLAYAESGALVALLVPGDAHHEGAVRTLYAMWRAGYRIVVSPLTLMETLAAIRKKITTSNRCRSGSEEERAGVEARAQNAVDDALELLDKKVKEEVLEIMEPENWSPDLLLLYAKVLEHAGYVLPAKKGRPFRYRGVGSCDWLQFALARHLGAAVIFTTDAAFADIEGGDDEFGHIRIQMASGPLADGPPASGAA